jgi:hypothetical protein
LAGAVSVGDAPAFGTLLSFSSVVTVPGTGATPIFLNCSQADTFGAFPIFSPQWGRMTALPLSGVTQQ